MEYLIQFARFVHASLFKPFASGYKTCKSITFATMPTPEVVAASLAQGNIMTPEEFRQFGHQLIDWIADQRTKNYAGDVPVMAPVAPGWLKEQLPKTAPLQAEPFEQIVVDLDRLITPACSHFIHPRFFGYFPSNGDLSTVLADLVSTGLGQLGLNWQSSPALTELEEVTTDWLRQATGLSDQWQGVIHDTASVSTLVALLSARERTNDYAMMRTGQRDDGKILVIYTSAHAHSSVDKAALMAGFGKANIRYIETDEHFALKPEKLNEAIERDKQNGMQPCAVVATVGTTGTTAVDPVLAIAKICHQHQLWLHVDAALAGSAMILPECRKYWAGIESADSLVMNPHKWLGVAFDCSCYYVRDAEHLVRVMSTNPSYLQTQADGSAKNYRDWGLQLGRRFRALKLWFLFREQGLSGLQERLRRDIANAQWLATQMSAAPQWKILAPVTFQTLCVRHEPTGLNDNELDTYTLAWVNRINKSGFAYMTPSQLHGHWMVRISIGALPTEREHVEALWQAMQHSVQQSALAST